MTRRLVADAPSSDIAPRLSDTLRIIGLIGAFQYFTEAYVLTQGGPADSTLFYGLYLYSSAFRYFKS
jgi:ABC-type sugar transport system permease subunit